jgi:hypothetical protein
MSVGNDQEKENPEEMSIEPYTSQEQAASEQDTDPMVRPNGTNGPIPAARPRSVGVGADERKLWAGGAASAIVVGLVALVGVLVSRWLFRIALLAPAQDGAYGNAHTTTLILLAMAAPLVATALVQLLMLGTLRPFMFFGWIVALVTTIAVAFPFSTTAPLDAKIATAIVNLVIGLATGLLVGGVATRSIPRASRRFYDF